MDLETYNDKNAIAKVYAIGLYLANAKPVTFYIDKDLNFHNLNLKCY